MHIAHKSLGWLLIAISAWCFLSGLGVVVGTTGQVMGSDFGMLITVAHCLGMVLMWLATWSAWQWTAPARSTAP
jgi:hypothetical protein